MTDKQEVENMILQAKLERTKSSLIRSEFLLRLVLTLGSIAVLVLGIALPLIQTNRAIDNIEKRFKELVGTQLRKPNLQAFVDGQPLASSTITVQSLVNKQIMLKNIGDSVAENIRVRLLFSPKTKFGIIGEYWVYPNDRLPDELGYSDILEYAGRGPEQTHRRLDPTEALPIDFYAKFKKGLQEIKQTMLLKIYYGQPQPTKIYFTIVFDKSAK